MNNKHITRGCFNIPTENAEQGRETCNKCTGSNKLDVYNWLEPFTEGFSTENIVEVRFKNTRKGYFINNTDIPLLKGDIVAVEASPGHDVGVVSLTGDLVPVQMKRYGASGTPKKIYRKAKPNDVEKWFQSIELEQETMRIARQIVSDMKLGMKISDVEYQGDKTKATFYYISDERVDFRQLIKEFADNFRVRIEMKQIGARQEAGKMGGIGTCGREFCCSKWMSTFVSVSTSAARCQEVSLNPQKLAGQCGKLKCCLNYELKSYLDAQSDFPDTSVALETERGKAYHTKTDVFRRIIWYSFEKNNENAEFIPLDVEVVKEIIALNRKGIKVAELIASKEHQHSKEPDINYQNAVGEDSINRFDEKRRKKKKNNKNGRNGKDNIPPTNQTGKNNHIAKANNPPHPNRNNDSREFRQQDNRNRNNRNRNRNNDK